MVSRNLSFDDAHVPDFLSGGGEMGALMRSMWAEDLLLIMNRRGYEEETYFTFSYSPIRRESGTVEGMFCACQETTEKVVGERRLKTLRESASQAATARSPEAAGSDVHENSFRESCRCPFCIVLLVGRRRPIRFQDRQFRF
ncbi:MAG: hypothetical protein C4576_33895 [Desulfobacteraceae bacterium]|nr:MAG: hypothetical protein C4576_33895 [Desulfobacteraceae bacterium]